MFAMVVNMKILLIGENEKPAKPCGMTGSVRRLNYQLAYW